MSRFPVFQRGDAVSIRCEGRTVPGTILMASSNGISIMLGFDAMIDGHIGMMPIIRDEGGTYHALVTDIEVEIAHAGRDHEHRA